jgi:hypothetical protein
MRLRAVEIDRYGDNGDMGHAEREEHGRQDVDVEHSVERHRVPDTVVVGCRSDRNRMGKPYVVISEIVL